MIKYRTINEVVDALKKGEIPKEAKFLIDNDNASLVMPLRPDQSDWDEPETLFEWSEGRTAFLLVEMIKILEPNLNIDFV